MTVARLLQTGRPSAANVLSTTPLVALFLRLPLWVVILTVGLVSVPIQVRKWWAAVIRAGTDIKRAKTERIEADTAQMEALLDNRAARHALVIHDARVAAKNVDEVIRQVLERGSRPPPDPAGPEERRRRFRLGPRIC